MTNPTGLRLGIGIYRKADGHILTVGWIGSDKFGGYDADEKKSYKDDIDRFNEHYTIIGNPEWENMTKPTLEELKQILDEPLDRLSTNIQKLLEENDALKSTLRAIVDILIGKGYAE